MMAHEAIPAGGATACCMASDVVDLAGSDSDSDYGGVRFVTVRRWPEGGEGAQPAEAAEAAAVPVAERRPFIFYRDPSGGDPELEHVPLVVWAELVALEDAAAPSVEKSASINLFCSFSFLIGLKKNLRAPDGR